MVETKYSALEKLNLFINIYLRMLAGIPRISWWSAFLLFGVFQTAGLAGLTWYYMPVLVDTIYPVLLKFLPAGVFHYPEYYLVLPSIYSAYENFILGPTLWVILSAAAVYRFGGLYSGEKLPFGKGVRGALGSYFPLLAIWLVETIFVLLVLYVPSVSLETYLAGSPNRAAVVSVLLQLAAVAVSSVLIYAIPGIVIDRKGFFEAVGDSIGLFFRNMIFTYFIVLVPSVIRIITNMLLSDFGPRIIELLNPDLIPVILLLHIILGIFINLFIYGTAVFAYKRLTD